MTTAPRVRFAPSPTGMFHVGSGRTTLFNWLFARRNAGTFILRIEDTDATRNHPEWTDMIYRSIEWLGMDWDDAYPQSRNVEHHRETAEKLFADGKAYYCDCTAEDVAERKAARGEKTPGYDGFCSDRQLAQGPGRALKFRVPREGTLRRVDVIRGTKEIELTTVEDFAILRSDGSPLFVLANALDDVLDGITHVVRAEEHLANVAKQILIRQALGLAEPVWVHLPMIVNEQRKKLSKRRDRVSMDSFRDEGFLPEAMVNYLATLGWAPPGEYGEELAGLEAMTAAFAFEDVTSSPAQFDVKKLSAFNGFYIRRLSEGQFNDRAIEWFRATVLDRMGGLVQERAERLPDAVAMVDFLAHRDPIIELDSWNSAMAKDSAVAIAMLEGSIAAFRALESWAADSLKEALEAVGEAQGLRLNKAQAPVRVAVTGRRIGPPLFESLELLGRERTLGRLESALRRLT